MAIYRRARSTRLLAVSLVMVSLLTITVDFRGGQSGPLEHAGQALLTVIAPLQTAVSKVLHPIGSFFTGLAHISSLESENARLKREVNALRQRSTTLIDAERQNEQLLALLHLQSKLGVKGVAANVIGASFSNFEWTITIDKGSSAEVRVGLPVISGNGLVGHVVTVSANAAVVQLIIDPHSGVAARLAVSGDTGLVVGQTDRRDMTMDLVSAEANVNPEDPVVTSGYVGGLYPPGVPIGYVSHVYTQPGSLTETVAVRPAVDFSSLEFVEVVTSRG
jgi:rod shape-determining protein MreC